ncbi:hypothetical protein BC936DRAFT_137497 [Jimgerdemannia flammicorona]|uniref:Uncharacterized protein n=1 Tax=Jimgerdemannia flammicorona TaxID=994334 RepID=A0A433CX82_9FUNG|nr:hypothetical protein BC936DRAFT_137497 [Jimgerdemannia flammicorona]
MNASLTLTPSHAAITFAKSRGIDLNLADHLEDLLRTNDFTDIEIDYISMPLGWGGGVGERHARNVYHVWTSVRPMLECTLGIDTQEFWKLMNETFENYRECRTWHKANYAFGRKPLASVREDQ